MSQSPDSNAVPRALVIETVLSWWQLLPVLWPPILIGYLAGFASLTLDRLPGHAYEFPRAMLLLGASWLGMLWAAAARAEPGRPRMGSIQRRLRGAGLLPWGAGLVRAGMVYGPALLVYGVAAARSGAEQQVGQANPVPVLALVLLPLTLILAALFALLPAVLVTDRPAGVSAALNRAKQLGDPMLAATLAWGGLLLIAVLLSSWSLSQPPSLLPNQVVGSLIWVLLAVAAERARDLVDADAG